VFRDYKINIRGVGGYVVGPGSRHATGVTYTASVATPPVACPDWLTNAVKERPSAGGDAGGGKGGDHWWRDRDPIKDGDRHNAIVAAAGWCRYMRIPLEDAVPTIRDVLRRCAGDKYTWEDARGKLEDVYDRYAAGDDRLNPNLADTPDADTFWSARSELSDLRDFARARRVSPWAMLGCVLAIAATRIGPHVRLPAQIGGHASLNVLVGLVGPSGAGKDAALAAANDWLAVTAPERIPVHELGTGQGIDSAYTEQTGTKGPVQHCDSCLFTCTEIDTLAAHGAMPGATVTATLRKVYNAAALGARYADRFKRRPVPEHHYRFGLICGIQPTHAGVLLDDPDSGTPQRWLWLPATDPNAPDHPPNEPKARMWTPPRGYTAIGQLDTHEGVPRIGSWITLDVSQPDWDAVAERRRAQLRSALTADADLAAHALLTRRKVAALLDLLAGKTEVTQEGWELAGAIMDTSDAARQACIAALATKRSPGNHARGQSAAQRAHIVEDAAEQRVSRGLHRILTRKGDWMTGSELRREIAGRDRQLFEAAVAKLLEAGVIEATEAENKGPTGRRYKACQ
jgi:hypothetical protein